MVQRGTDPFVPEGMRWCTRKTRNKRGGVSDMPLIQVVIVLIVVGVLLWLVNSYIPMAGSIKSILNAVVIIVVILWLLNVFGLLSSLSGIRIGK
jgi:vacuolar-type H+-ATPase subunit I/STV1